MTYRQRRTARAGDPVAVVGVTVVAVAGWMTMRVFELLRRGIDHRGREGRRHAGRTDQRPVAPRVHRVARSSGSSLMHLARVARDLPRRRREARPNETVW